MKKRHLILAITLLVMTACGQKETTSSDLIYLNYQETEIQEEAPKLSTVLKDIRYVALDTKDTCLLNRPTNITLTDKYIVMDGGHETECFVFDKKDGKYLRTIGMREDPGPTGYTWATYPLYVVGNEIALKAEWGDKYKFFSLDDGSLLRTVDGKIDGRIWPNSYLYPLNDSIMLQYDENRKGNRKYGLQICTWSGNVLKKFPATNNFEWDKRMEYQIGYPDEILFHRYKGHVYFQEFTSDTIFRLNEQLEGEPVYVVGKGDQIPMPELRNTLEQKEKMKRLIKFEYTMETDRYLLMMGNRWNNQACIYDKQTGKTIRVESEAPIGFTNDLNGFLPFWPIGRGCGSAQNEVWGILSVDEYMEGVEQTGKNPLGIDLQFDDNPVIVIGTLK
ncbi:MAG: 6-bladed beta-propeller [Bacteroides sp.]|nr:6-bladed beta-propeller [Bacteroides sp.]